MPPDLPLHLLHSLWIFSGAESVVQAAHTLGISQPALTKQLQTVAAHFPVPLFAIRGRRKILTPFGQALCAELAPRFDGVPEQIRRLTARHADPRQARLEISARRGILDRIAAAARFPGQLTLVERPHAEIITAVQNGKTDLGITYDAPVTHELIRRPLFREHFQAVVPRTLASRRPIGAEWEMLPCVAYQSDDRILQEFAAAQGVRPSALRIHRITANYASLAQLIAAGIGWGVIPAYLVPTETKPWTFPTPARGQTRRDFRLLYRPEIARSPWLPELYASLRAALER